MNSLSKRFKDGISTVSPNVRLAPPILLLRASKRITNRWSHINVKEPNDQLVEELEKRRHNEDWSNYFWKDLIHATNALFDSDQWSDKQYLIRYRNLIEFLIDQIYPGVNRLFLRTMYRKYVQTYDPKSKVTKSLAKSLNSLWREMALPIETLVNDFRIFDPKCEPSKSLASFMRGQNDPFEALLNIGVESPHGLGMMADAHYFFVSSISPKIAIGNYDDTKRLLNWLNPPNKKGKSPLQGRAAAKALDSLLGPWKNSDPDRDLRNLIEVSLCRIYNDPRTADGVWRFVSEQSREVIFRWLTKTTINTYFDIVTKVDSSHMWTDRKQLWKDLFHENKITEAWCALSKEGIKWVKRNQNQEESVPLAYGENCSRHSQDRNKCLLLMKVQGRWVVEGSNNFPTWVYPSGIFISLKSYEKFYTCEQIRQNNDLEKPERIVHDRNWRNKVIQALNQ